MASTLTCLDPVDGEAILPLSLCREQLRVDGNDDDTLIIAMRAAAIEQVERMVGKSLSIRRWQWEGSRFASVLRPGIGPIVELLSVGYRAGGGASAQLDGDSYRLAPGGVVAGQSGWPVGSEPVVIVRAGYEVAPPALLAAVQLSLGHLFRNREAVVTGTIATALPLGVEALCASFREERIG